VCASRDLRPSLGSDGLVWIHLDRRALQREQAGSVWSRPVRRRASGYGSGGQPGALAGAAHWSPFRSDMAAGWWTVLAPAVQRGRCRSAPCRRRSRVSAVPGRAGFRCPAGRPVSIHPDSRSPLAASTGHLTKCRRAIRHARSCRRAATAAAGPPPSCRSRTPRRCLGGCGTGHRGRLGCPLLLPEPRSVSTRSVSEGLVSGRLVSATDPAGACGCPPLQEQVACPASAPDGILDRGRRVGVPEALDLSPGCARYCALTGQLRIDFQATSSMRGRTGGGPRTCGADRRELLRGGVD
jgi:hypothetical protein